MFWAVVPLSWYPALSGAVLGIAIAYLVPMAAWGLLGVPLGPFCGFVRCPFRFVLSGLAASQLPRRASGGCSPVGGAASPHAPKRQTAGHW